MHSFLLAATLFAQLAPQGTGPSPRPLKGVHKPLPMAPAVADLVRSSMKEFAGSAVVVVEGELPLPMLKVPAGMSLFGGKLRLLNPRRGQPYDLPVMPWMDTNTVRSGPNVAGRIYPMGWGY